MDEKILGRNDLYIISKDFKLISFNKSVADNYPGIKVGDYCYEATMKRSTPCLHCPLAGNSECDSPIYYDPFYEAWIEAIFCETGDGNYCVTCRPAQDRGTSIFSVLDEKGKERLIKSVSGHAANDALLAQLNEVNSKNEIMEKTAVDQNKKLQEALKNAEKANAAKSSFLFNMSHDIRTPMNAIMGFTDLLEKNIGNEEKFLDYVRKIRDSSIVLLSIINNVLEMSRIETGHVELNEKPMHIQKFNDSMFEIYYDLMEKKGVEFSRSINVQHEYIYCDSTKLREIFENLISNAYKYTPSGGKVHVGLEECPCETEGYVNFRVIVSDTGVGMDKRYIPHLFEEFSREHTSTESKIEGTGLGMSIVKKLLDIMNGTIAVESKLGEGTTFTVTIPHRIASERDVKKVTEKEINRDVFQGKRLLLAEDNALNAEIAVAILEEAGFVVEWVKDGLECVEAIEDNEGGYYSLVLMDVQMPNMNGYQATKIIRRMDDREKATVPIVAMTANAFEEDKATAIKAGMNSHISKPINLMQLLKALSEFLE